MLNRDPNKHVCAHCNWFDDYSTKYSICRYYPNFVRVSPTDWCAQWSWDKLTVIWNE
jgi:hypothetical protein